MAARTESQLAGYGASANCEKETKYRRLVWNCWSQIYPCKRSKVYGRCHEIRTTHPMPPHPTNCGWKALLCPLPAGTVGTVGRWRWQLVAKHHPADYLTANVVFAKLSRRQSKQLTRPFTTFSAVRSPLWLLTKQTFVRAYYPATDFSCFRKQQEMGAAHVSWFSGSQWTRSWSLVPPRVGVRRQGNRTRRQPTHWLLTVDRVDGRWSKRSLRPRTDDATVVMTQAMFTGLKERNVDVILKINWDQRG